MIFQLIMKGGDNGSRGGVVVFSNEKRERGLIIQYQLSFDLDKLLDNEGVKIALAKREVNEKNYKKNLIHSLLPTAEVFAGTPLNLRKITMLN